MACPITYGGHKQNSVENAVFLPIKANLCAGRTNFRKNVFGNSITIAKRTTLIVILLTAVGASPFKIGCDIAYMETTANHA